MTPAARWNVEAGNFFFRRRNSLFPIIIVLLLTATRPERLSGDPRLNDALLIGGALLALAGQAIRLLTIGYDYIDRGGREGKVYASRLVHGGVYAHVRNPMYVGNLLMMAGLLVFSSSPIAIALALPFFLFAYQAIVAAEEAYLRRHFGADYETYCGEVPRWVPRLKGLAARLGSIPYDWLAAIRKDYGNVYFLVMSFIVLSWWRRYFLEGPVSARAALSTKLPQILAATVVYFTIMALKKKGCLG